MLGEPKAMWMGGSRRRSSSSPARGCGRVGTPLVPRGGGGAALGCSGLSCGARSAIVWVARVCAESEWVRTGYLGRGIPKQGPSPVLSGSWGSPQACGVSFPQPKAAVPTAKPGSSRPPQGLVRKEGNAAQLPPPSASPAPGRGGHNPPSSAGTRNGRASCAQAGRPGQAPPAARARLLPRICPSCRRVRAPGPGPGPDPENTLCKKVEHVTV